MEIGLDGVGDTAVTFVKSTMSDEHHESEDTVYRESNVAQSKLDGCSTIASTETDTKSHQKDLYTTENFKIRIDNVHPHCHHSNIKQRLQSLNLQPKKIKKVDRGGYAFVTFANEEARQNALKVLQGHKWRGKYLTACVSEGVKDPFQAASKRKQDEESGSGGKKVKFSIEDYKNQLISKITPLSNETIEEQLKQKQSNMMTIAEQLSREMSFVYKDFGLPKSVYSDKIKYKTLISAIRPSPVIDGYRNKCEFTIGIHPISGETVVGFRCGDYKSGTVAVMPADECLNVSSTMKSAATNFCVFISSSKWNTFDPTTTTGHWMNILVRTTSSDEILLQPQFCHQDLDESELTNVRQALKDYAVEHPEITSLYIRFVPRQVKSQAEACKPPEYLYGQKVISESLLGLKFQISPSAFFQVNTAGAEVLYSNIIEFASINSETVVVDVCCGTGTIGLLMAKTAKSVIGIEMVPEAVEDAKVNAELNDIKNIEFRCGKAEDLMPALMSTIPSENKDIVAIVDPPRAGLHNKVTLSLRKCTLLKKLVYVSCEPKSAVKNFVDLMRPVSKRWSGEPFRITKMLPVDMFPHTDKCELIVLFER